MHLVLGNLFSNLYTFLDIRAVPAVVPHIRLNNYCHIFSGVSHHFVQHLIEETYTILKRAAIFVMTMVRTRTNELRNKISMTRMNLYAIKSSLSAEINCLTKLLNQCLYLTHFKTAVNSWRIKVKAIRSRNRHTMACAPVRHIAAVTKLDTCFCTFGMYCIGKFLQSGQRLRANIQLAIKRNTG